MNAPLDVHRSARAQRRPILQRLALQHLVLGGERVAFRFLPDGPGRLPLVGLHGLGSNHTDLLEVARASGGPALLVDLPGFGASEQVDRDYPVSRAAAAVLELLGELGLERPVWLGCSYGGHVALRAALDAPEQVAHLVLVDSGGLDPDPPAHLAAAFDARLMAARSLAQVAASCERLVGRPNAATRAFTARRTRAHACGTAGYRAIARSAQGALADDAARRLEEVAAPVDLLWGDRDPLVPLAVARAAARRLPRARLTVLRGVGHMPWLEVPSPLAARVRQATSPTPNRPTPNRPSDDRPTDDR